MKYCTKCKEPKPLTDYYQYKKKDRPNIQIFSYCKICTNKLKKKKEKVVHAKNCEYCLQEFKSVRFDARFCTAHHSVLFKKDPDRKILEKVKYKSKENTKIILNTKYKVSELCQRFGINKMTVYNIRIRNGISTKKISKKPKAIKDKFKYEDNFKVKKESKESKVEKWNKIFKEIQC